MQNQTQNSSSLDSWQQQLPLCMRQDQFSLKKQLQQAQPNQLAGIGHKILASIARRNERLSRLPKPNFPEELPVSARQAEIAEAISQHQVVIVCGETGSGKTTQLPKICLSLGRGVTGLIGHTQPRRIAARAVASRIAQELQSPLGEAVGYKVRFNDKLSANSYVKLMTDGILLAETQTDRFLNAYDTIIIDEAHERSLNIDFLLGYLKQLLPKRPDLKIIVTSATIDADRFAKHFSGAPIIEVSGRTYPVEVRYRPLGKPGFVAKELQTDDEDDLELLGQDLMGVQRKSRTESRWLAEDDEEEAIEEAILDAAEDLLRLGEGDILVFLPGEREIRDTAEHLRKYQGRSPKLKHVEILPLFARLSIEDQQKIFKTTGSRRIVLATNVAETSLTVPGIKYVIDTGLARVNRYSTRAKVEQLQIEKISQAAAKQRAGRCGRVSNGICVRLYAEDDFNARPAFTDPEILRSSLASVILRMADLRLGDVAAFPFIEPPSTRLINDGYQLLQELGAVNAAREISPLGQKMARLPLDPRMARMLLAGQKEHCLNEILVIASALSMQDSRERPMDKREAADQAHAQFKADDSDFMSLLKLWEWAQQAFANKKSNRDLLNQCHQRFLSFLRLKEWRELHAQLLDIAEEMGLLVNEFATNKTQAKMGISKPLSLPKPAAEVTYAQIHRALLSGLLGNIGFKDSENESYLGARGIRFQIAPGSALKKARPKWVMAAELVETTKLYARCVAKIDPDWIEPLAQNLTQSHYSDPRWDARMGMVNAWERVSLYGLTIIPKRRVHYGPINLQESREIMLREGLAAQNFQTKSNFYIENQRLIAEVQALEHKARRQDVLVDENQLFAFYDAKIPQNIMNAAGFEHWLKEAEKANPRLLYLTRQDLMRHGAAAVTEMQFPPVFKLGEVELPLKYRFEPGHALDGVTATVPLALLNQLEMAATEWLVPGMRREKLAALIKNLPKNLRSACVPVPEFVTGFLEHAEQNPSSSFSRARQSSLETLSLPETLASYIHQKTTLKLSAADFDLTALPAHLNMNFSVIDDQNRELAMGRDWRALKQQLGQAAQLTFRNNSSNEAKQLEKTQLKQWDFGDLPIELHFQRDGVALVGYPALEDNIESVAIKLFDTLAEAEKNHRQGVVRLMRFELKEQIRQLEKNLPNFNQNALQLRTILSPDDLREAMLATIADRAFIGEDDLPRNNAEFMALKTRARARLPAVSEALGKMVTQIAAEYNALLPLLNGFKMPKMKTELETQIKNLLPKQWLSITPWQQLLHLPRYLKAMQLRMQKYAGSVERDARSSQQIQLLVTRWEQKVSALQKSQQPISADLQQFRWLLEELRVSLFAQELKTPMPVSVKRLEKILEAI